MKEWKGIKCFQLPSAPSSRPLPVLFSTLGHARFSKNGLLSWCVGPTLTLLHAQWGLLDASQDLLQPSLTAALCFISAQLLGRALLQVMVFSAYTEVAVWVVCLFEHPVNPTVASGWMTSGVNGTWHECWVKTFRALFTWCMDAWSFISVLFSFVGALGKSCITSISQIQWRHLPNGWPPCEILLLCPLLQASF